jgi:hypothetical protein
MATFTYPTNAELTEVAQDKLPALQQDRRIFEIMPIEEVDASVIIRDQLDNYLGLQNVRGINGAFPLIQQTGSKQYVERPGYYGEGEVIDEIQLVERRQLGSYAQPVSIDDLVMQKQDKLLNRRLDRIEWIGWTLLSTGVFAVSTKNGALAHQGAYSVQTFTASVGWATAATSTPLADFTAVQLLSRGHGAQLGAQARAYMNRKTFNYLRQNTNTSDIYGRSPTGIGPVNNVTQINDLLMGDDLPTIVIYDNGYLNDSGTFVPFIADNYVVVVGPRPASEPVAKYIMTRNASAPTMAPGAYMWVDDNRGEQSDGNAPSIVVDDSQNGGPIIQYPSNVAVMRV